MKNKHKTYLLLSLVVGIWGVLTYRILTAIQPNTSQKTTSSLDVDFHPQKNIERDSFAIQKTTRDPFLGTLYKPKKKKIAIKKKMVPTIEWPSIRYDGIIQKHGDDRQQIFVVTINRQQYLMKLGQVFEGITLLKGDEHHIKVGYKKAQKSILKP